MTPENVEEQAIAEDPALLPEEKQFSIVGTRRDEFLTVHSEVASVTKWMLRHPAVEITSVREHEGAVVACSGTLPVGLLDLKAKPRQSNQFSRVLSSATLRGIDG